METRRFAVGIMKDATNNFRTYRAQLELCRYEEIVPVRIIEPGRMEAARDRAPIMDYVGVVLLAVFSLGCVIAYVVFDRDYRWIGEIMTAALYLIPATVLLRAALRVAEHCTQRIRIRFDGKELLVTFTNLGTTVERKGSAAATTVRIDSRKLTPNGKRLYFTVLSCGEYEFNLLVSGNYNECVDLALRLGQIAGLTLTGTVAERMADNAAVARA